MSILTGRSAARPREALLYVGTYTQGKSEGIYVYRMDLSSGRMAPVSVAGGIDNPSFLAIDPKRRYLYAVNESAAFRGRSGGGLTSFTIDPDTGALGKLNEVGSPGIPCHLTVHRSGRFVLAANYAGGNVVLYPVRSDGSLGEAIDVARHSGRGADPERQEAPHAHCAVFDEAGRYAFAADLGIDKVMVYRLDADRGRLVPNGHAATRPGAGPRHFVFHPNGRFAYVINELDSTVAGFSYDREAGKLAGLQVISTLPAGFPGKSYCADIHIHPTGRFLYGSNRGHDSLAVFAIDERSGRLAAVGRHATGGRWPRNFAIDPTGRWLLAANQHTGNVTIFRIDPRTGLLEPGGRPLDIPMPVCLIFGAA